MSKERGCVGLGGVVRDHEGEVKLMFRSSHHLSCSVEISEAMAIRKGLKTARDYGLQPLLIESDASSVVRLIINGSHSLAEISVVIHDIQNFLASMPSSVMSHILGSCNRAAHAAAKWSVSNEGDFVWFE
ncbi:Ribonuclease H-like domain containing protein [Parasponia andersonii]|uniref:Ribonuclease H-like domain containing protein n=1 Tax=Parasponia andersonii TaxID=3476 RepID=A0A2P5AJL1_PARAD|nr:Ribonuclease H-like domain containing protein [Parasponia andersonii]